MGVGVRRGMRGLGRGALQKSQAGTKRCRVSLWMEGEESAQVNGEAREERKASRRSLFSRAPRLILGKRV